MNGVTLQQVAAQNAPVPLITCKEKKTATEVFPCCKIRPHKCISGIHRGRERERETGDGTRVLSHGFVFYAFKFLVFFLLLAHLDHGLISFY